MSDERQEDTPQTKSTLEVARDAKESLLAAAGHLRILGYHGKAKWCELEAGKMRTRGEWLTAREAKAAKHEATAGERATRKAARVAKLEAELVELRKIEP